MRKGAERVLLETLIDQSCRGFGDDPHRELRKLVDLGGTVATGRFQKSFFELAQDMLQHDDSPYYALVSGVAQHTSPQAIKQLGINVGYASWTKGAGRIRQLEAQYGHNIPWALIFEAGPGGPPLPRERLAAVLAQGRQLGIHTFFFFGLEQGVPLRTILALAEEFDDCAFILLLTAQGLPQGAAPLLARHPNCLPCLQADTGCATEELLAQLYRLKALFGLWVPYGQQDLPVLLGGEPTGLAGCAELAAELSAPLVVLAARPGCTASARQAVGEAAYQARLAPSQPTLLMDLYSDVVRIDQIISSGSCLAQVWPDGRVAVDGRTAPMGLDGHTLRAVLASAAQPV